MADARIHVADDAAVRAQAARIADLIVEAERRGETPGGSICLVVERASVVHADLLAALEIPPDEGDDDDAFGVVLAREDGAADVLAAFHIPVAPGFIAEADRLGSWPVVLCHGARGVAFSFGNRRRPDAPPPEGG